MSRLTIRSRLGADAREFWDAQSAKTVNFELGPWIRKSAPTAWRDVKLTGWCRSRSLFESWILQPGMPVAEPS